MLSYNARIFLLHIIICFCPFQRCACDFLCVDYNDCCSDYTIHCRQGVPCIHAMFCAQTILMSSHMQQHQATARRRRCTQHCTDGVPHSYQRGLSLHSLAITMSSNFLSSAMEVKIEFCFECCVNVVGTCVRTLMQIAIDHTSWPKRILMVTKTSHSCLWIVAGVERVVQVSAQQLHAAGLNFIVVVPKRMRSSLSQRTAVPFHDRVKHSLVSLCTYAFIFLFHHVHVSMRVYLPACKPFNIHIEYLMTSAVCL